MLTSRAVVEQLPRLLSQQTMTPTLPHYLLFAEASRNDRPVQTWRFVLQNVETQRRFCATDSEPTECSERLELLAVVRGLEALEGPARVTLVTKSRYVSRGMKSGLKEWRTNNWCWERFGRLVPVRDCALWKRVNRALQYHTVNCQAWHFEEAVEDISSLQNDTSAEEFAPRLPAPRVSRPKSRMRITRQHGRLTVAPAATSGTFDAVWSNVKSLAESIGQPSFRPTA